MDREKEGREGQTEGGGGGPTEYKNVHRLYGVFTTTWEESHLLTVRTYRIMTTTMEVNAPILPQVVQRGDNSMIKGGNINYLCDPLFKTPIRLWDKRRLKTGN